MIEGKKYKLMNFDEEYQASEAISRLLYYSNSLNNEDYEEAKKLIDYAKKIKGIE